MSTNADSVKDMDVSDILEMIKSPEKTSGQGKCTFIRKIEELPKNIQEAILLACDNPDVSNRDIHAFINTKTDVRVNKSMVQEHRHRDGCSTCLYGSATS